MQVFALPLQLRAARQLLRRRLPRRVRRARRRVRRLALALHLLLHRLHRLLRLLGRRLRLGRRALRLRTRASLLGERRARRRRRARLRLRRGLEVPHLLGQRRKCFEDIGGEGKLAQRRLRHGCDEGRAERVRLAQSGLRRCMGDCDLDRACSASSAALSPSCTSHSCTECADSSSCSSSASASASASAASASASASASA